MRKLLLAAGLAALATGSALAADPILPPVVVETPAPPADWTGFYIGIIGGGAMETKRQTNLTTLATTGDFSGSGWLAGVTAGADVQLGANGRFVLGVLGDVSWSNISATTTNNCAVGCANTVNWLATGQVRAGLTVAERGLIYIMGGVAAAGVSSRSGASTGTSSPVGYALGVGGEVMVTERLSVKGEFVHTGFGANPAYTVAAGTQQVNNDFINLEIVRVGLNLRF